MGGGVGEEGADAFLFQGFDPFPTQRVPLCTILKYPYFVKDPEIFLKAASKSALYTNFEGGVLAEKTLFFGQNFPKSAEKSLFLSVFFSKFCLRRRKIWPNQGLLVLWESSENQFGRPKKRSTKFLKYPPPSRKH